MQKIMLTYGPIIGAVIIATSIISISATQGGDTHLGNLQYLGYLVQFIAFSVIFIAVKKYRDDHLGGIIKFGSAFKLGLGISLVASIVYVLVWEVYLNLTDYTFIKDYAAFIVEEAIAEGKSAEEISALEKETESIVNNYSNPFFRYAITLTEVFPTGILLSLIAAFIFRTKNSDHKNQTEV